MRILRCKAAVSERSQNVHWTVQNLYLVSWPTGYIFKLVKKILDWCMVGITDTLNLLTQISIRDKKNCDHPYLFIMHWSTTHRSLCVSVKHYKAFSLCWLEGGTMMETFTCWPRLVQVKSSSLQIWSTPSADSKPLQSKSSLHLDLCSWSALWHNFCYLTSLTLAALTVRWPASSIVCTDKCGLWWERWRSQCPKLDRLL